MNPTSGMRTMRRTLLTIVTFLLLAGVGHAQYWEQVGSLPAPRADMASATLGDTLFLIGGSVPGTTTPVATSSVLRYSLANNVWLNDAPQMNFPRIGAEAIVYGGYIFVFGGRSDEQTYISAIESWTPGQPQWDIAGELLPARSGMRAIVKDGQIYVTGGSSGPLERHNRIDRIVPYWGSSPFYVGVYATADTLPSPRSHHGLAELGGDIFCFGGYAIWPLSDCYRWDSDGWTQMDSMSYGVGGMSVAPYEIVHTMSLVVAGGRAQNGEVSTIQYGFADGQWDDTEYIHPLPLARTGHVMVPFERTLYVFGGSYENASGQKELLDDVLHLTSNNTAVVPERDALPPGEIQLAAHPNPSNGAVTITVAPGAQAAETSVNIYNLLGQEVAGWTLPASRGSSLISWDGRPSGGDMPSGVYFLVARNGGNQKVVKLFRLP